MHFVATVIVGFLVLLISKDAVGAVVDCANEIATGIPETECNALVFLYDATEGDNWTHQSNWKTDSPVADWYGVAISSGHVTEIDLHDNHLVGSLPAELEFLPELKILNLKLNQLTGGIPAELGNLKKMEWMDISQNSLSGSVPPELGEMSSMFVLALGKNNLSGTIPSELGSLGMLNTLYLHENQLSGWIPSQLGDLQSLYALWLNENRLTGPVPSELANINDLAVLKINGNRITGNIPSELGNLEHLEQFRFDHNDLEGDLPDTLANLKPADLIFFVDDNHLNADAAGNALIPLSLQSWFNEIDPGNRKIHNQTLRPQAGVIIAPVSDLVTTEAGGEDAFDVVLNWMPANTVEVEFTSSDTTEGSVDPSLLIFTPDDWNIEQKVIVKGRDDDVVDGNASYFIDSTVTSGDAAYNGISTESVEVSNIDNDRYSVVVSPVSGLVTTEDGGKAVFRVFLSQQPSADVRVGLVSTDVSEGAADSDSLVFTAGNWNTPQIVTITGMNDDQVDGNQQYTIQTSITSDDPNYDGIESANVSVTNIDNDAAGISISPNDGLVTTEDGGKASFRVRLNTKPTETVRIEFSNTKAVEATVSPDILFFDVDNWFELQTVTLTGKDDGVYDGNQEYSITSVVSSNDANYDGLPTANVNAVNIDTTAPSIQVFPVNDLVTNEDGGVAKFRIVVSTEPTADVMFELRSSDEQEGVVQPGTIVFNAQNWRNPVEVTITGQDDDAYDHDQRYWVRTGVTTSLDQDYDSIDLPDVSVTNQDNESCSSPPDHVSIEFSSFASSPEPYICRAVTELASPAGTKPLEIEQGAEVHMYSPVVILNSLFKVEVGGVLKIADTQ
ncbi:MAG TPA: hypothetical protein EYP34_03915 [Chromatiaceae bacterium]|nr:hypothetical protein [Chromatiaceae bacterium]